PDQLVRFLWLSTIGPDDSFLALAPPLLLAGAGMGLFAAPNRAAMMSAVEPGRRGIASSVGTTFVNTGMTVSLGVTLVILSRSLPRSAIQAIFVGARPASTSATLALGFLSSIHEIFFVSALLILAALVPTVWRGLPPRSRGEPRGITPPD
ncbi:MAG: hypothetical protein L3J93_02785, partial [Thermoplasmata archaeon]|nr:hypothetical protein [Thermoplasmata archaeon]